MTLFQRLFARPLSSENGDTLDVLGFAGRPALEAFAAAGWVILDEDARESELVALSDRDPFYSRGAVSTHMEKLGRRAAGLIARRRSDSWGVPSDVAEEALVFHVWTELCTLVPMRRLARRFASRHGESAAVLLPLPPETIECFGLWRPKTSINLMLATALRRAGHRVAFYCFHANKGRPRASALFFCVPPVVPLSLWLRPGRLRPLALLVPFTIRCPDYLRNRMAGPVRKINSKRLHLGGPVLALHPVATHREGHLILQYRLPAELALTCLDRLVAPELLRAWRKALSIVRRTRAQIALTCDHINFVGALVAAAVRRAGGQVVLLPHAGNPANIHARRERDFDAVLAGTRAGAALWRSRFPGKKVYVNSANIGLRLETPRPFHPDRPVTFIVFGGAHRLGDNPLFPVTSHIDTYRALFRGLAALEGGGVQTVLKPKPGWETEDWFRKAVFQSDLTVPKVESRPVPELDYDNMVFVGVTIGGTYFIEGMTRGVPGMMLADQVVVGYYDALNDAPIPVCRSDELGTTLHSFLDARDYCDRQAQQRSWLEGEIGDDSPPGGR